MFIGKTPLSNFSRQMNLIDTKDNKFHHKKMVKPIIYSLFAFSGESLFPLSNLEPEKIENKTFKPN
jgi:hypothetical protein